MGMQSVEAHLSLFVADVDVALVAALVIFQQGSHLGALARPYERK